MEERLEDRCRNLINRMEYAQCEKELGEAMAKEPHSPVPHNLMGILMEKERNHVQAMKHFRAAYGLDPTYIPARYNMERQGGFLEKHEYAYEEIDCPVEEKSKFHIVYDQHHIGHLVRK